MKQARGSMIVLVCVLGCGGGGFDTSQYPTPESLLAASVERFELGDCNRATIGLQRVAFELSARDPRQGDIRFYLAECRFKDGEYLEATREYRRVADNFSRHPRAPLALLRAGEAYAKLWRNPELDPTYGESARLTFSELLERYSGSEAAQRAVPLIAELNEKFARKSFKTGEYYFKLKGFDSAIIYYRDLVANFDRTSYAPRAVARLIEAYDTIGYEEEKQTMCQYLAQYHPEVDRSDLPCSGGAASQ